MTTKAISHFQADHILTRFVFPPLYVVLVLAMLLTTSCINTKRIVYLEDMREDISYPMNAQPEMRIQRDDRLSIIVNSRNPELTVPFNISTGGDFQVTSNGDVSTTAGSQKQEKGYMVDLNGYIEFPILGKLKVVDLTRKQVADLIKNRLISENLINDPLIFVDILNIKITVMGEVKSPQVLQVEDSRITLLEAITRTGGVTTNALLDRVAVIREEGNERKMYMHDIRSSDIFYSPCYYLQQNDMVYIHPKFAEANTKERRTLGFYSFGVTLLSLITTLTVLLK